MDAPVPAPAHKHTRSTSWECVGNDIWGIIIKSEPAPWKYRGVWLLLGVLTHTVRRPNKFKLMLLLVEHVCWLTQLARWAPDSARCPLPATSSFALLPGVSLGGRDASRAQPSRRTLTSSPRAHPRVKNRGIYEEEKGGKRGRGSGLRARTSSVTCDAVARPRTRAAGEKRGKDPQRKEESGGLGCIRCACTLYLYVSRIDTKARPLKDLSKRIQA